MARKKRTEKVDEETAGIPKGWSEFLGIALLAIGALMFGGLASYQFGDGNLMGPVGRLVAGALYAGFGMAGYLVVLGVVGMGIKALMGMRMELRLGEGVGFTAATVAGCILLHVVFPDYRVRGYTAGGLAGELLGEVALGLFDHAGTYLLCVTAMTLGLIASTPLTFAHLLVAGRAVGGWLAAAGKYMWFGAVDLYEAQRQAAAESREARAQWDDDLAQSDAEDEAYEDEEYEDEEYEDEEYEDEEYEDEDEEYEDDDEATAGEDDELAEEYEDEDDELVDEASEGDEETDEEEPDAEDAANGPAPKQAKRAKSRRKAGEELPEIVLPAEDAPRAATDANDDDDEDDADGNTDAPPRSAKGKLAPPRAAELAAARSAAGANANAAPKKKKGGAEQVKYLVDDYALPPLELFAAAERNKTAVDRKAVYAQAERIVQTLAHFRIKGKVTKVHPGPVITRFEFKPEAGVKLSKIESLENDLAMALEAIRIRILAPIPGKATVGFEVPNPDRETVYIQENLSDEAFAAGKAKLPMALGKDITGRPQFLDLAKAPHLLVAGATGSGKSVGVNSMICSILRTRTPEEVRMILIDPKMLEFSIYEDVPHLLLPVITDAEKANAALKWAVNEMERRYGLLSDAKVRNLEGYNQKLPLLRAQWEADCKAQELVAAEAAVAVAEDGEEAVPGSQLSGVSVDGAGQTSLMVGGAELPEPPEPLPYIVVIIDEFADLMSVASKEVEMSVARIAAKARAAGIHLIVATQRPSVDVITGTIKNNFPSRIAFQVTSDTDSRTILDQKGAKQLLGMGDMLYMDRGKEPDRIHGCFVSENEIEKVVDFIKKQAKPAYNLSITEASVDASDEDDAPRKLDPLYDKAVAVVAEAQKVSTSMIQRRLGVGYNRAAKIVESMEEQGVIGPARGTTPREVYVSAA